MKIMKVLPPAPSFHHRAVSVASKLRCSPGAVVMQWSCPDAAEEVNNATMALRVRRHQVCQASATGPDQDLPEELVQINITNLTEPLQRLALEDPEAVTNVLDSFDRWASCLVSSALTPNWYDGRRLLQQLVDMKQQLLGPEHPSTLDSRAHLAVASWPLTIDGSAKIMLQEVVRAQQRVLGPAHPDTLYNMITLAYFCQQRRQWSEARELLTQALELSLEALGAEHPVSALAESRLEQCCIQARKYSQ